MKAKAWPERPKGIGERSYRKYMAKKSGVTVNGTDYTLQSVSPQWYMEINDKYGMTGGKRDTAIEPKEVASEGIGYFNRNDDIDSTEKLLHEIESFLRKRE